MKEITVYVIVALISAIAFYNFNISDSQLQTEINDVKVDYFAKYGAEECTKTLEIECAIDIERTVVSCAKAFETEGADVIADIKCAKDLLADKKHCWPCICGEAKKKGWHIIGC